jgi:deazaflavin-dependent oxidoreductase (nitroreductase family)
MNWLLRMPNAIYAAGAGRLLGHRFLALHHRGRRTGREHTAVLEVLSWDGGSHEAVVMSGLGPRSNWLRNVRAAGAEIEIGRERWSASVRTLGPAEAAAVLADYERRNRIAAPVVRRILARLSGFDYDGSEPARRELATRLPLVAFSPARSSGTG